MSRLGLGSGAAGAPCLGGQYLGARSLGIGLAMTFALLAPASLSSQIAPEGPLKLQGQFDLSNPGARSLGMAGAFVARADDATAAYVNPAGLINLRFPEISLEGRNWNTDVDVYDANGDKTTFDSSQTGASFVGVAYPLKRLTLALYRHELATLEVSGRGAGFQSAEFDLGVTGVGLAAGIELFQWFRLGVAVVGYQSDIQGLSTGLGGDTVRVDGDGTELGYTIGYQANLAEDWSFGFVFRDAPTFDVQIDRGVEVGTKEYTVPDLVGLGLSWQATHRLVSSIDYSVIYYSSTVSSERHEGGVFVAPDAHETRLGLEYTIWEYRTSPAFRVGVWRDPDHRVRWKPVNSPPGELPRVEFPRGDDEIHFSLGAGVVIGRLQLDAAADFSESSDIYSLSLVYFP